MTSEPGKSGSAPKVLFILWCLGAAIYYICFAFGIAHWNSFRAIAAASTFVLMAFSRTDAVHEYDGNRFMRRHKQRLLPGFFGILCIVIGIGYALKGTRYQVEFLGLLLAAANLFTVGLMVLAPRRSV